MPKFTMYQSLHTTVIGPEGKPVELQIRSFDMDRAAEYGVAAHWRYKSGDGQGHHTQQRAREWLQKLLDMQRRAGNPIEFLESVKHLIGSLSASAEALAGRMIDPHFGAVSALYSDRGTVVPSSELSYDMQNQDDLWAVSVALSGLKEEETFPDLAR